MSLPGMSRPQNTLSHILLLHTVTAVNRGTITNPTLLFMAHAWGAASVVKIQI